MNTPTSFPFRDVTVRLILPAERVQWEALMREHHYLGPCAPAGNVLRYVACLGETWLALLSWQSAALKCRARDEWIGWSRVLQYQRLHFIANNSRFLILPQARRPHLASRVLGLSLRRLSADWRIAFDQPVLIAETFVDPSRFEGTCYAAANWKCVGQTRGFAKLNDTYVEHGQPKTVWVYPLHRHARTQLCDPYPHPSWSSKMSTVTLSDTQMESLVVYLRKKVKDVRRAAGRRHSLPTLIAISTAAALGGARSFAAIAQWAQALSQPQLKRLRGYFSPTREQFEAPSEPTIRRMLTNIDAPAIDTALCAWLSKNVDSKGPVVIDGKTLKGARRKDGTQVHLLSALLAHEGITLAQREIPCKTNEIPELCPLIESLDLEGRVVMADAMHTQCETANYIVEEKKADYVFTVKRNQPTLYDDIKALDEALFPLRAQTIDKGHGRIEVRTLSVSTALNDYVKFPHVGQVGKLTRSVTHIKSGKETTETVFLLTSLTPQRATPDEILALNRAAWSIENRSHWVRDVTFDEDRSQVRTGNAPRVMASIRNFVIGLLRLNGNKSIAQATRTYAARPSRALALLGV